MRRHGFTRVVLPGLAALSLSPGLAEQADSGPRHLGRMTAFWRHRPVVDRWLTGSLGFVRIPDYMCRPGLSFPYVRKQAAQEIPFVDHVTVVRLLGGWNLTWRNGEVSGERPVSDYDLACRGDDGGIQYRWELLGPRLDPYVRHGYGLTIVLDNTPWCFPAAPDARGMGQAGPPADMAEWETFIEQLCRQLVARYGFDTANAWRFRMGTECQGRERFSGTQEQFHRLYDHAAAAVKRVLPGAAFGPFNLAGGSDGPNVSYSDVAEHCVKQRNHATGEVGAPFDFAAVSIYTSPSILRGILRTTDPAFKAQQKVDVWNTLAERWPKLANVSREVHEFGILGNEFGAGHGEPGARGAAWRFHVMVCLLEGGLDRLWHWGVFEPINVGERHCLLTSTGWLLSVLEHAVGGEMTVLEPAVEPVARNGNDMTADLAAIAAYQRAEPLARPGGRFVKSLLVVQNDRALCMTSVYHEDRFVTEPVRITLSLPAAPLAPPGTPVQVRHAALTRTGAVHYRIRQDLEAQGLLAAEFAAVPGLLSSVTSMAGRPGWLYVDEHWPRYEAVVRDVLTLKPFGGRVARAGDRLTVTFEAAPPSVTVLEIRSGVD